MLVLQDDEDVHDVLRVRVLSSLQPLSPAIMVRGGEVGFRFSGEMETDERHLQTAHWESENQQVIRVVQSTALNSRFRALGPGHARLHLQNNLRIIAEVNVKRVRFLKPIPPSTVTLDLLGGFISYARQEINDQIKIAFELHLEGARLPLLNKLYHNGELLLDNRVNFRCRLNEGSDYILVEYSEESNNGPEFVCNIRVKREVMERHKAA